MRYGEFSTSPLPEPVSYASVAEGNYQIGDADSPYDHIATFNVYTCKAVSLHDPSTGRGLLAHINGTTNIGKIVDNIAVAYGEEALTAADVKVVQATIDRDKLLWPRIETVAEELAKRNPRSLALDINIDGRKIRGVALSLGSGALYELYSRDSTIPGSREVLTRSLPLRWLASHPLGLVD